MDGIIVGYGTGTSLDQAKQTARRSIVQQIEVTVSSQTAFVKKTDDDQLSIQTMESTQLKSTRTLKNIQTIHQEQIDELYYIALQIDQRPAGVILDSKLDDPRTFSGSPVITGSRLINSLDAKSGTVFPVSLLRKEQQWLLSIDVVLQPIEDLTAVTNWEINQIPGFTISLAKKTENRLKAGEAFQLSIKATEVMKYVTVFNIYSDGRVVTLLDNHLMTNGSLQYPSTTSHNQLVASPVFLGQADRDLYLAIGSEEKIDTTKFRKTTTHPEIGESSYNLHKFIHWLDDQRILAMSPLYVEITP